ncbi:unnamed protein product [Linum trigynum]|uniref:Uncharacterized protein n=1 Tax=Linum trigynum TaxID=586398 RepID=A0AAV2GEI0_9ROSI
MRRNQDFWTKRHCNKDLYGSLPKMFVHNSSGSRSQIVCRSPGEKQGNSLSTNDFMTNLKLARRNLQSAAQLHKCTTPPFEVLERVRSNVLNRVLMVFGKFSNPIQGALEP